MKTNLLHALSLPVLLALGASGDLVAQTSTPKPVQPRPIYDTPEAVDESKLRTGVQITEVGLMRTLVVMNENAADLQKLVLQRLNEVDFRIFPSPVKVSGPIDPTALKKIGGERKADLILYSEVVDREKSNLGGLAQYEAEATVTLFSPVTGELMVTETARVKGERLADADDARRTARETALDQASREVVARSLEKAHKLVIHEAKVNGLKDRNHFLAVMEHLARMEGVYHAREVSYDAATRSGVIEIIASPKADSFWKAHLERMPKQKITDVRYIRAKQ